MFSQPINLHKLLFAPDLSSTQPGIITDANNIIPTLAGVRPMQTALPASAPLPAPPIGAFLARFINGSVAIFAATASHIYLLDGTNWTECDNGQTFTASLWQFAQAGDAVIATDLADSVQVYTPSTGKFQPLAGSPPRAAYVIAVDPGAGQGVVTFLMGLSSDMTAWGSSAPGNPAIWSFNVTQLSASSQFRATPGPITAAGALAGQAVGFKARGLYLGTFSGPPYVWNFQCISRAIGTISPSAVVNIIDPNLGDALAFIGTDDFYILSPGPYLSPIPNALREWFFGDGLGLGGVADIAYLPQAQGSYDATTGTIFFHFASRDANPRGLLDTFLGWHRSSGRWIIGHRDVQVAYQQGIVSGNGLSYDQFARQYGTYAGIPDGLTYGSLGFAASYEQQHAIFGPDNILYTFSGAPSGGYITSGDIGDQTRIVRLNRVAALFSRFPKNTGAVRGTLTSFVKQALGDDPIQFQAGVPLSDQSMFDFIQAARWHSFTINLASDCELVGYQLDLADGGRR